MSGPGWHKDDPAFNTPPTRFVSDLERERDKALADAQKVEAERDEKERLWHRAVNDECCAIRRAEAAEESLRRGLKAIDALDGRYADLSTARHMARQLLAASENPEGTEKQSAGGEDS